MLLVTASASETPPTEGKWGSATAARRPVVALVGPHTDSHGGVSTTLRLLMSSQLADEFELVLVSTYRDGTVARKGLEAARGLVQLARMCTSGRVSLVHLHTSSGSSLARKSLGIAVARAAGVPVVLQVHGGGGFHSGQESKRLLSRLERRAIRWALEWSDIVVALSTGWEQSLASRGRLRGSRVIPNAPDLALTNRLRSGDGSVVLFLGHLYRDKGVYDLVDAFARVQEARPALRLVLAGEGPETNGLRSYANRLGLNATVDLPGWIGTRAKTALFANAACFVLASHHEGLPLALLEAMLSGVPVVATSVGGVPEVVEDGRTALLVPPNDVESLATALARVLDDPKLAARLSHAAQERALAEYTPDGLAKRVGDLYRDVLASR